MERQQVLQIVKKAVHEVDDKAEIILFGSRARGDFHDESDWDFLILTEEKNEWLAWEKIREKLFESELKTNEAFSSIVHTKTNWENFGLSFFYKEVQKDGIII